MVVGACAHAYSSWIAASVRTGVSSAVVDCAGAKMRVSVKIPFTGTRVVSLVVPNDALNNIVAFLDENPEYLEEQLDAGYDEALQYNILGAEIDPD